MRNRRRAKRPVSTREELLAAESGDLATGQGRLAFALAYPNTYSVGMASLGFQAVRRRLIDAGALRVERAFALGPGGAGRSLESERSLGAFDAIAFSIAYELDYLHVLESLDAAGLALFASRRGVGYPLVVAGGIALMVNPSGLAPFVDLIVRGRDPRTVDVLAEACAAHAAFRIDRQARVALYDALERDPSFEITPGARQAVGAAGESIEALERAIEAGVGETLAFHAEKADDSPSSPLPASASMRQSDAWPPVSDIATPYAELGRRVLVEIADGCANRCAFCWLGHHCGRFAPWSAEAVLAACEAASDRTECQSVGLVSSAVGAHPEIDAICEGLLARGVSVAFSSLRAEDVRPSMLEALVRSGQRGLTLAPEAGDEALRRSLGKGLDDAGYLEAIESAQRAGLEDLKLYFMIGLPGETDEAVDRIVVFADRARRLLADFGRPRGRLGRLSINLGVYVPKPGTPLARRERPGRAAVRRRAGRLTRAFGAMPNVQATAPSLDLARAQEILSMGGPEAAAFLYDAWREGGNWRVALRRFPR